MNHTGIHSGKRKLRDGEGHMDRSDENHPASHCSKAPTYPHEVVDSRPPGDGIKVSTRGGEPWATPRLTREGEWTSRPRAVAAF
ncbi:hypothetical protein MTBSS4_340041 [Magnetospirillum sp. SS-4]|nr:hypothetical protein MTBSS4_340041 [Magnetospirillum sp. SS-4]